LPEERPYLRVANVLRNRFDLTEVKTINCTEDEASKHALNDGDVLVVEGHASVDQIGRSAVWRSELANILHQNHLIRVRCSDGLLPDYLNIYLNSSGGRDYIRSRAKSSSGLNTINSTVVRETPVPTTDIRSQEKLTGSVKEIDVAITSIEETQSNLQKLLHSLLNGIVV